MATINMIFGIWYSDLKKNILANFKTKKTN